MSLLLLVSLVSFSLVSLSVLQVVSRRVSCLGVFLGVLWFLLSNARRLS